MERVLHQGVHAAGPSVGGGHRIGQVRDERGPQDCNGTRKAQDLRREALHGIHGVVAEPFDSYGDHRKRSPQEGGISNWDPISEEIIANIGAKGPSWCPIGA